MLLIEFFVCSFFRVYLEFIFWIILVLIGFGKYFGVCCFGMKFDLWRYMFIYVNVLVISDIFNFFINGVFVGVILVSGYW